MIWNMRKKRGKMLTVELLGSLNSSCAYVEINGTKYTKTSSIQLKAGTQVLVHCSASNSKLNYNCRIFLNGGTTVAQGTTGNNGKAAEYSFKVTDNCTIDFAVYTLGNIKYYSADITMPA